MARQEERRGRVRQHVHERRRENDASGETLNEEEKAGVGGVAREEASENDRRGHANGAGDEDYAKGGDLEVLSGRAVAAMGWD